MEQQSSSTFLSKSEAVSYALTAIDRASPLTDNILPVQGKSNRRWPKMQRIRKEKVRFLPSTWALDVVLHDIARTNRVHVALENMTASTQLRQLCSNGMQLRSIET